MKEDIELYNVLLKDIKRRVRQGQLRASHSANAEMLAAYVDIGSTRKDSKLKDGEKE